MKHYWTAILCAWIAFSNLAFLGVVAVQYRIIQQQKTDVRMMKAAVDQDAELYRKATEVLRVQRLAGRD